MQYIKVMSVAFVSIIMATNAAKIKIRGRSRTFVGNTSQSNLFIKILKVERLKKFHLVVLLKSVMSLKPLFLLRTLLPRFGKKLDSKMIGAKIIKLNHKNF